jgi:hypothetical protein
MPVRCFFVLLPVFQAACDQFNYVDCGDPKEGNC